jgi:NAD-dependent dihydropyrimidine dehydrogenase PreA subunit
VRTRLITIEGKQIGIAGLDEVMEELYQAGIKPEESATSRLFGKLRQLNYIPPGKEEVYIAAFLNEYKRFSERKQGGAREERKSLGTWQGIPREEIPWFPNILDDLCDGCQVCLKFCAFGVYEYDETANKVRVVNPLNCVVGCSGCAPQCKPKAIVFPPLEMLDRFGRR